MTFAAARKEDRPIRADIQGLRALAVLAVIVFHIDPRWLGGGFLGVDIFFVISGFLVTSIVLRAQRDGVFSFLQFYGSRARRIAPAYFVMLAITSFLAAILLIPKDFHFYEQSLYSALYFASNRYFAQFGDYFAPRSHELPLLHTWSLGVEMQFYLLLPILIGITPARYWRMLFPALILLCVAASGYAGYLTYRQETYFALSGRAPEFLIGSCLALLGVRDQWSPRLTHGVAWAGFAMVAVGFVFVDEATMFAGFVSLAPCFGAALIIATPRSSLSRLLSAPVLVWIGDLSYSLYLWHWPLLAGMRYYSERHSLSPMAIAIFAALVTGLSWLSYRFVEAPFRRGSSPRYQVRQFIVGASAIILVVLFSAQINRSLVPPLPVESTRFADLATICHGRVVGNCYRGDLNSASEVLVLGDSHAGQLNHFFDVVGTRHHFRAQVITANGCVGIPGFNLDGLREDARAACAAQMEVAGKYLDRADLIVVAALWGFRAQDAAFMEAFDRFLSMTDVRDRNVLIIGQIPMLTANVLRKHRFEHLGMPVSISRSIGWDIGNRKLAELAARHPSARFLDYSQSELFSTAPFHDGELIYSDNNHLNEIGSYRLGAAAAARFPWPPQRRPPQ